LRPSTVEYYKCNGERYIKKRVLRTTSDYVSKNYKDSQQKLLWTWSFGLDSRLIRVGFVAENCDWDIFLPQGNSVSSTSVVPAFFHINLASD
jgi:hypothetical protein